MELRWLRRVLTPREEPPVPFDPMYAPPSFNPATWATARAAVREHGVLWSQYTVLVELYRYYLDIAWKSSVWFYAVTGAILVYYFDNVGSGAASEYLPLLVWFAATVSAAFTVMFISAAPQLLQLGDWMEYIAGKLHLPGRPHAEFAARFVLFNGTMYGLVSLALVYLALTAAT